MRAADLTELDRREIALWRVLGRWQEARDRGDGEAIARLDAAFRKRLRDYEAAHRQEVAA